MKLTPVDFDPFAPEQEAKSYKLKPVNGNPFEKPKAEDRPFFDSLGRQIGLTARAAIGGIGGLANAVADPIVSGINAMGGNLPIPSQALERTMTSAGLPVPDSKTEKFAQSVSRGMVGAAAGGRVLGPGAIGTQIVAGGSGAGGSDLAEQAGLGPLGQTIAGVTAGVLAPSVGTGMMEGGRAIGRAVPGLIEPLTKGGRERIAARAMQGASQDRMASAAAAKGAPEYVPGSVPTLAQAVDDPGLSAQAKALQNRFPDAFAQRAREQDAARQSGLERVFGSQTDVKMAEDARDAATSAMREAAFKDAGKVSVKPIVTTANSILKSGAGKRQEVERSLNWVKSRVDGETNVERLYAVRQDINDIIAGKYANDPEKAAFKLASGELRAIKGVIDAQIEKAAPGFKNYLAEYAGRSREIGKAQLGQEIKDRAISPLTEALSPAAFTREFEKRGDEIAKAGPVASDALTRVAMDLRRAAAPGASTRAPGSDTLQNLVANNMLSRAGIQSSGPVSNLATKVLGFPYKAMGTEEQILELIRNGHLDPKEGARLLSMPLSQMPPSVISGLLNRLNAIPVGGLLGINAAN